MRRRNSVAAALLAGLLAGACGDESDTAVDHGCKQDSDCPHAEMRCVPQAGVCVGFATPLEAVDAARAADAGP